MKKSFIILSFLASALFISCEDNWDIQGNPFTPGGNGMGGGSSSGLIDFEVLSSFTVDLDETSLSEQESIPTSEEDEYYNDYIENNFSQKNITSIVFNGKDNATVTNIAKGDTINIDKGHVEVHAYSKGLTLKVSGSTTDGSLKIYSDKKFSIALQDASISNPNGSAINIQNGNCFVVLEGSNSLSDSSSASYDCPEGEDMKAVFFSEDDLRFSGSGSLSIKANNNQGKACLSSDDAIFIRPNTAIKLSSASGAGNGIKTNDAIVIKGGVLNIDIAGAGKKGLSSDGIMQIDGGRTSIITTGGVDTSIASDPTGCAAIKCDSTFTINNGSLHLKSTGQGGKGISSDYEVNVAGGDIYIITEGSQYGSSNDQHGPWGGNTSSSNSVSPKGIRCDGDINISGGNIYVRTYGKNGEGIESKTTLSISGGNTAALAYDDGFNAKEINISGGKALAVSNGDCDGIDSNGSISATGGVLIGISSTTGSEDGLDTENSFTFSNATVIGLCSQGMGAGRINGHYIKTNVSGSAGDYVTLCKGDTPLVTFMLPRTYNNGRLILSTPSLSSGSYSLKTGITPSDGTLWMNYQEGCTKISGGKSTSVTAY